MQGKNPILTMKTTAIIPAAGNSSRMGKSESKLFLMLGDMPVLAHTLLAFDHAAKVDEVIIAARQEDILLIWDTISEFGVKKVSKIINGGASRAGSVNCALGEVSDDTKLIAIHDGARPLIDPELIDFAVSEAARKGAVTLGVPVKDTVKRVGANAAKGCVIIAETLAREELYQIQTPQVFRADLIKEAYEKSPLLKEGGTPVFGVTGDCLKAHYADSSFQKEPLFYDDCGLVEALGVSVHLLHGDYRNIKITTEEDLAIGEGLMLL